MIFNKTVPHLSIFQDFISILPECNLNEKGEVITMIGTIINIKQTGCADFLHDFN